MQGFVVSPNHTHRIFHPKNLASLVKKTIKRIGTLPKSLKFNAIAGSGHSGIILGSIISHRLKMPILAVRKKGESAHDDYKANGFMFPDETRYLIIDDLIASGDTIHRIVESIQKTHKKAAESLEVGKIAPAGILLYDSWGGPKGRIQEFEFGPLPVYTVDINPTC